MDKEKIQQIIEDILEIVNTIPEEYRVSTYELLLKIALGEGGLQPLRTRSEPEILEFELIIPSNVKAFLKAHNLAEDVIENLFYTQDGKAIPIYDKYIDTSKKRSAQLHFSLLKALENALLDGKFVFSAEDIRSKTIDMKCYDENNFSGMWAYHSEQFKDTSDKTKIELSHTGKENLANLIKSILNIEE